MGKRPRLTIQAFKVLNAILTAPEEIAGADMARMTAVPSGTLYPILLRLEEAGWLTSRWEEEEPQALQRPRRRLYRVTPVGEAEARSALREAKSALTEIAWA